MTLDFHPEYNVIVGANGSGKTSLLESIHILCQGKSFKTTHLDQCVQHQKKNFLLFGKFDGYKAGVSRTYGNTLIRIDGETISRVSQLAEKSPVISIDSKCFELLIGPPANRREYIDWCLFHVEHLYRDLWNDYARAIKQKNTLLKAHRSVRELDYWDEHIAALCKKIYFYRSRYLERIIYFCKKIQQQMHIRDLVRIEYVPGWKKDEDPLTSIKQSRNKELQYGYSIVGSHRDVISIKVNGLTVTEVMSRGQLKKLAITLMLSQILLVQENTQKPIIVLLDDLDSELDNTATQNIIKLLSDLEVQVFITNIRNHSYLTDYRQEYKMFHVEHGMIKPVKNT